MPGPINIRDRLEQGAALLAVIALVRLDTRRSGFGLTAERAIVDVELKDLEDAEPRPPAEEWDGEEASDMPGWTAGPESRSPPE